MTDNALSFLRVARRDYYSSYFLAFLITTLVFYILVRSSVIPVKFPPDVLLIAMLGEMAFIALRVAKIRGLLASGVPVDGSIERIYRAGSGAGSHSLMEYRYVYDGEDYKRTYPKRARLKAGQRVTVIVNPAAPERSIIKQIFLSD
jgi:hypothetical protein